MHRLAPTKLTMNKSSAINDLAPSDPTLKADSLVRRDSLKQMRFKSDHHSSKIAAVNFESLKMNDPSIPTTYAYPCPTADDSDSGIYEINEDALRDDEILARLVALVQEEEEDADPSLTQGGHSGVGAMGETMESESVDGQESHSMYLQNTTDELLGMPLVDKADHLITRYLDYLGSRIDHGDAKVSGYDSEDSVDIHRRRLARHRGKKNTYKNPVD